jgi:alpha-L-rhamnosidase
MKRTKSPLSSFVRNYALRCALSIGISLLVTIGSAGLAKSDPSSPSAEEFESWMGHSKKLLRPVEVVSTTGDVADAEALLTEHDGSATLTMAPGGIAPMIILDYGRDVGGLPVFEVTSVSGTPKLQAIYSESQQSLLPSGDGGPGFANAPGDPSRVNTYPLKGYERIVNRLVQGGERFQAVTLTSPGSVTLRRVGIQPTFFFPHHSANRGYFRCSDSALNEIWHLGAYTLRLDQVPPESIPPLWTVSGQGLDVKYCPIAVHQGGGGWTDYTVSFNVQVLSNEAAWVVREAGLVGYVLALDADNDTLNQPNSLRIFAAGLFGPSPVATVALPFDLKPGVWHAVKTVASASKISVFVDDQPITSFDVPVTGFSSASAGSFGFQNANGADGLFRNLSIVSSSGETLYASGLTDSSVLDVFAAGTSRLPTIIDGAKRDRLCFTGDLALAAPSLYYSNNAVEYVAGSLEMFASIYRPDGEVCNVLSPLFSPGFARRGDAGFPPESFYSLSYSLHFINDLYEYYLYTGDKAFAARQWPAVAKELGYLAAHTNAQHLLVTDASNGADWAIDLETGVVAKYSVLYYRALENASSIASALGKNDVAASLQAQASSLKENINATLFNVATGLYNITATNNTGVAQDANSLAVLFGVAPIDQALAILQRADAALATPNGPLNFSPNSGVNSLLGPLTPVISPFMSGFEANAHFEVNDATGALDLIRTVWGHMRKGQPFYSGATWERLAADGTPAGASLAHAWGSGPTAALSKYVLGVRPIEPGYKAWLIEPQPGDLSWAEGRVPTPYGPIQVRWEKQSGRFVLEVNVPAGTRASIGLPAKGSSLSLSVNGKTVNGARSAGITSVSGQPGNRVGFVYLNDLAPGSYQITVTRADQ